MVKDNSTCVFHNTEPNVATFYRDQQITEDVVEFPSGAVLVSILYFLDQFQCK